MSDVKAASNAVKIKICATRSLEAAQVAFENGAHFLGFVFTPLIKTHTIDVEKAKAICKVMKGKIALVGVFQNMPLEQVQDVIEQCDLDYAQLHGDETPEYLDQIKVKKIKAFRLKPEFDVEAARAEMKKFAVDYYLVDRRKQSEGQMLHTELVSQLAKEFPLICAGGLNPDNVGEVIKKVRPQVVDVASGVETDGRQDLQKIREFVRKAKYGK